MLDIYCPHCRSHQALCFDKLSPEEVSENPELGVPGAVSGLTECTGCNEMIHFDLYPPYTKSPLGMLLKIHKKDEL